MLCSCLYYTMFYQLTQLLFCPSSITCVNSMDASYIPIAEARGFTTHWINYLPAIRKYLVLLYKYLRIHMRHCSRYNNHYIRRIRFLQILHLIFPSRNLSESQTNLYTLHTAAARLRFSRALLFLLGKAPK